MLSLTRNIGGRILIANNYMVRFDGHDMTNGGTKIALLVPKTTAIGVYQSEQDRRPTAPSAALREPFQNAADYIVQPVSLAQNNLVVMQTPYEGLIGIKASMKSPRANQGKIVIEADKEVKIVREELYEGPKLPVMGG